MIDSISKCKIRKMAFYVNNSWRKVKFKLLKKFINAVAAEDPRGRVLASAYTRMC